MDLQRHKSKYIFKYVSKKIIFYQELKVQILFSSINDIVKEESQYLSDEEYETFENIQSATTKQSHKIKYLTYKGKVDI